MMFCWGQTTTRRTTACRPAARSGSTPTTSSCCASCPASSALAPRLQLGGWMSGFNVGVRAPRPAASPCIGDYPELRAHRRRSSTTPAASSTTRDIAEQPQGRGDRPGGARRAVRARREPDRQVHQDQRRLLPGRRRDRDAARRASKATATRTRSSCRSRRCKTAFHMGDRVGFFAMTAKPGTDGAELERQVRAGAVAGTTGRADRQARDRLVQHVRDVRQVRDVVLRARG